MLLSDIAKLGESKNSQNTSKRVQNKQDSKPKDCTQEVESMEENLQTTLEVTLLKSAEDYQKQLSIIYDSKLKLEAEKSKIEAENKSLVLKVAEFNELLSDLKLKNDKIVGNNELLNNQIISIKQEYEELLSLSQSQEEKVKQLVSEKLILNGLINDLEIKLNDISKAKENVESSTYQDLKEELLSLEMKYIQSEDARVTIGRALTESNIALERALVANTNLKAQLNPKKYGAQKAFKQDLPYTLGNIIVNTRSIKDVLKVGPKIVSEINAYNHKVHSSYKAQTAIESYADGHEVEKLKKHLSYQIGAELLGVIEHPKTVVKLPINLFKTFNKFKFNKK